MWPIEYQLPLSFWEALHVMRWYVLQIGAHSHRIRFCRKKIHWLASLGRPPAPSDGQILHSSQGSNNFCSLACVCHVAFKFVPAKKTDRIQRPAVSAALSPEEQHVTG